jgi:hypothetical protein
MILNFIVDKSLTTMKGRVMKNITTPLVSLLARLGLIRPAPHRRPARHNSSHVTISPDAGRATVRPPAVDRQAIRPPWYAAPTATDMRLTLGARYAYDARRALAGER